MGDKLDFFEELEKPLKAAGAVLTGYADLRPVINRPFPGVIRALSLALAFDPFLAHHPGRLKANAAYVDEYYLTRARLDQLVRRGEEILHGCGYQAWGYGFKRFFGLSMNDMEPDKFLTARYQQKTTAVQAGLGWIGKMGVLVTKEYGPHVWLGTILTDAPWPEVGPARLPGCGQCRLCQDACPAGAIKGVNWAPGLTREDLIDIRLCQEHRHWRGRYLQRPMCGLCLAACPFGRA